VSAAPRVSAVVPAYNESESLPQLHRELVAGLDLLGMPWEILYVDDGSRDGSDRVYEQLCAADPRVRAILLRRNFGKSAALATGFRAVRGELVVTLDADLQDDPSELPRMLEALEGGLDLVSGWKVKRHDPITKTLPSKLFNAVTSQVAGIRLHDFNCGFKLYRREVVDSTEVYGELHRFIPALAHWRGFRVGEIGVNHRARQFGRSKFGAARFVNGFLDLLAASFISTSPSAAAYSAASACVLAWPGSRLVRRAVGGPRSGCARSCCSARGSSCSGSSSFSWACSAR
jgi:glycosyltransferase involved in cell wall biosynthesis